MISSGLKKKLKNKKNSLRKCNILCVGDIILDNYIYGDIDRISPEAPIPILLVKNETHLLGGVGNVAKNITSLGARSSIFYLSSSDVAGKIVKSLIRKEKNIKDISIQTNDYKIPIKTRFINDSSHLLRLDREKIKYRLTKKLKSKIVSKLEKEIKKTDLILLSDYNKGLLDKNLIVEIVNLSIKYNKLIIADPKKNDLSLYSNINLITPNQKEINDSAKKKLLNEKDIISFSKKMIKKYNIGCILATRSEKGMILINKNYVKKVKANAKKVIDVTGAGDTVISVIALMLALGFNKTDSSIISNYAAGKVIGKTGTATITFKELIT